MSETAARWDKPYFWRDYTGQRTFVVAIIGKPYCNTSLGEYIAVGTQRYILTCRIPSVHSSSTLKPCQNDPRRRLVLSPPQVRQGLPPVVSNSLHT